MPTIGQYAVYTDPERQTFGGQVLLHHHVNKQLLIRSLRSIRIPAGVITVIVWDHDKVHETGGKEMTVNFPGR